MLYKGGARVLTQLVKAASRPVTLTFLELHHDVIREMISPREAAAGGVRDLTGVMEGTTNPAEQRKRIEELEATLKTRDRQIDQAITDLQVAEANAEQATQRWRKAGPRRLRRRLSPTS